MLVDGGELALTVTTKHALTSYISTWESRRTQRTVSMPWEKSLNSGVARWFLAICLVVVMKICGGRWLPPKHPFTKLLPHIHRGKYA